MNRLGSRRAGCRTGAFVQGRRLCFADALACPLPRRFELLQRLAVPFQVLDLEVPQVRGAGEAALDYVRRVALDKALAGLAAVRDSDPQAQVLGADTEVVLDERVFGKPADAIAAAAVLRALSGREHEVITVVALARRPGSRRATRPRASRMRFAALDEATIIAAYVATGEPTGKAGAPMPSRVAPNVSSSTWPAATPG